MQTQTVWTVFCLFLAGLSSGCRMTEGQKNVAFLAGREVPQMAVHERPAHWGTPLPLGGVPNFARVTGDLYRGDEPTANGMKNLAGMGVKTVICVRALHSTESRTAGLGLRYRQINMWAWSPQDEFVVQFLTIMNDPANRPAFIHCYTGGDRAGLYVAIYRVAFCGWSKEEAKREMLYGGYGFHEILVQYLVPYFDNLDIDAMKRRAGIP